SAFIGNGSGGYLVDDVGEQGKRDIRPQGLRRGLELYPNAANPRQTIIGTFDDIGAEITGDEVEHNGRDHFMSAAPGFQSAHNAAPERAPNHPRQQYERKHQPGRSRAQLQANNRPNRRSNGKLSASADVE